MLSSIVVHRLVECQDGDWSVGHIIANYVFFFISIFLLTLCNFNDFCKDFSIFHIFFIFEFKTNILPQKRNLHSLRSRNLAILAELRAKTTLNKLRSFCFEVSNEKHV